MMCIRQDDKRGNLTQVELYDLYSSEKYQENIALKLSVLTSYGSPYYIGFSPLDTYMIISEKPVNGNNTVKIYNFLTEQTDFWTFSFEFKG